MPQGTEKLNFLLFQIVRPIHQDNAPQKTVSQRPQSSLDLETVFRIRLISLRWCFSTRRRRLEATVGLVFFRDFGLLLALSINATSLFRASCRFRSCVRNLRASITRTPFSVILLPPRRSRRSRTSSGSVGDLTTSKRSFTAVATLFTFCPPGPEERTNSSLISRSSMAML